MIRLIQRTNVGLDTIPMCNSISCYQGINGFACVIQNAKLTGRKKAVALFRSE